MHITLGRHGDVLECLQTPVLYRLTVGIMLTVALVPTLPG